MLRFWDPTSLPYAIDWSAWATLAAGIAAVIGAVVVGSRQANIAERQSDIADRQAQIMERQTSIAAEQSAIEQTRLRAELYDRRIVVYASIERYLTDASMYDGKVSEEVNDGLFQAISVARYLFGDDVAELGKNVHRAAAWLRSDMARLEKTTDEEKRSALVDKIMCHNDRLTALTIDLGNTMERYLRLSDAKAVDPGQTH